MTLDIFAKRHDLDENILHSKFKFLRDQPILFEERKIIRNWTEGFVDRDNKIVRIPNNFPFEFLGILLISRFKRFRLRDRF